MPKDEERTESRQGGSWILDPKTGKLTPNIPAAEKASSGRPSKREKSTKKDDEGGEE